MAPPAQYGRHRSHGAATRGAPAGKSGRALEGAWEVHDCFSITEILYEDLGFAAPGEGHKLQTAGVTRLGGELPVNTSGGLKCCGHSVGAPGAVSCVALLGQP